MAERDSAFVVDDALINCYLLVGSESGLKHRAQAVEQRLNLAALGGAIWISHVEHAKDLVKSISGKDRVEEGEARGVICAPVVLEVGKLYYTHVEYHSNVALHLVCCHRFPVPVELPARDGHAGKLLLGVRVDGVNQVLEQGVIKEEKQSSGV